jgi:transposase
MGRHSLTDREWARLEPHLPPMARTGRPPKDHRTIIDALLWLGKLRPRAVVGDRGYTGSPVRSELRRRGISAVIPPLRTEKTPRLMDWGLYRERNFVERLVGRLKEYRRIATRYDKLAASYLAFVQLAAIRMWL